MADLPAWLPARLGRSLAARPVLQALAANASWLVGERLAQVAVGVVVSALVVRYLGPAENGRLNFALSLVFLFSPLATLGMDQIIVRELARHPEREGEILGTALRLRAAGGIAAWALAALVAVITRPDPAARWMVAISGASSLFLAVGVYELWFHARIDARRLVMARTAASLATQGLRLGLVLAAAGAVAFSVAAPFQAVLVFAATARLFARQAPGAALRGWDGALAREMVRDSAPMLASAVAVAVYMKIDQVMLVAMRGDAENGIYAPASNLSEFGSFVPAAIATSAFPLIVKALDTLPAREADARLQRFYDAMVACGYLVAVPVALAAGPLVQVLYGPAYARTAPVLQAHVASLVFIAVGLARGRFLVARNHVWFICGAAVLGAAVNVLLNLLLIPRHGAMGAAWATVGAYAAANYLSGWLWRPTWRQTALLTRSLLLPVRPLLDLVARRRP